MDNRLTDAQPGMSRRLAVAFTAALPLALLAGGRASASGAAIRSGPGPAADAVGQIPAAHVLAFAAWAGRSGDNLGRPFIIIDKIAAQVSVFDGRAKLRGATIALVGLARGDFAAPDIGSRRLSQIPPEERITQAGRFMASIGPSPRGQDVLWIDYNTALALHRVLTTLPGQRRLERLRPGSRLSRRITYGCINVPVDFYERVVRPQFIGTSGVVYILPETERGRDDFSRRLASR